MKKLINCSLIFLLSGFLAIAQAETNYTSCQVQNRTLEELSCTGPTQIINAVITKNLTVTGPLEIQRSQINTLTVTGPVHLDETTISGRAIIYGTLSATKSKFLSDIYSASDSLTFINSTVNGVINMQSSNQPLIEVKESGSLNGNITFTQNEGIIKISTNGVVNGSVNNGKLDEQKSKSEKDETKK